ncbi:hypothetical protein Leryth_022854 [Lithospermum erythrorhizon]|nr:hypothetical protein Leryth_022854 [Lithospermum erythrorhizon]
MAFKKTLAQRLFNITKITTPPHNSLHNCRVSSPSTAVKSFLSLSANSHDCIEKDPEDTGIFRRFLHGRLDSTGSEVWSIPQGEKIMERLKGMDIAKSRISLDGLKPPLEAEEEEKEEEVSMEDARKLLRLSQLETIKSKLRQIEKNCIPFDEFVKLCSTSTSFGHDQGIEMAKILDQSGTVIVLGNVVFIRPEQVMQVINGVINNSITKSNYQIDPRTKVELEEMENEKAVIDKEAEALARKELMCGLSYLVIQTAAFMRLTFWDLSWDVMEPICFYVTSMHFMAGYAFFLRTSKEPSFRGFFNSRFSSKQKRLMKLRNFDLEKYNELRKIWNRNSNNVMH